MKQHISPVFRSNDLILFSRTKHNLEYSSGKLTLIIFFVLGIFLTTKLVKINGPFGKKNNKL